MKKIYYGILFSLAIGFAGCRKTTYGFPADDPSGTTVVILDAPYDVQQNDRLWCSYTKQQDTVRYYSGDTAYIAEKNIHAYTVIGFKK